MDAGRASVKTSGIAGQPPTETPNDFDPIDPREILSAARSLARRPAFAVLAIGLFALGVGAVSAVFYVVNSTMLRPLPYRDPEALFTLVGTEPAQNGTTYDMPLGYFQLDRWRSGTKAFARIEGYTIATMKLLGTGTPEPVAGALISAGFFDVLGVRPAIGAMLTTADEIPQAGVVVISHGFWMRRFGGDPAIIGKTVSIDEAPVAIIGVMPAGFEMPFVPADAWMPLPLDPQTQVRKSRLIIGVGRLNEGISRTQAEADLAQLNAGIAVERPDEHRNTGVQMTALREALFGDQRTTLMTFAGCRVVVAVGGDGERRESVHG